MERNQTIGIVLIGILLLAYFWLSPKPQTDPSVNNPNPKVTTQPNQIKPDTLAKDTLALQKQYGDWATFKQGTAQDIVLENQDVKITFNTLGGGIKEVLLKKYKTYSQKPLVLIDKDQSFMKFQLPTQKNGNLDLQSMYFQPEQTVKNDTTHLSFKIKLSDTQYFEQSYYFPNKGGYEVGYSLYAKDMQGVLRNDPLKLNWDTYFKNTEKDITQVRQNAAVNYYSEEDGFKDFGLGKVEYTQKTVDSPAKWVAFKSKFFLAGFINDQGVFAKTTLHTNQEGLSGDVIKNLGAEFEIPSASVQSGKNHFRFYLGPNDYQIVKQVSDDFGKNVNLGYPVINLISRFVIVPLFKLLENVFTNYGVLIVVLVLLVKAILLPLNYRSYISMAKTRVLSTLPEMVEIREKYKDDMQKQQSETMKIYQQVGVNPISGCIPVLLQMPILFSLFSLFPNLIELRQKPFLWAEDLSAWDSIAHLPFNIPFGYGDHVSLFTILMTASTLLYTYYTNQLTPTAATQQSPINMKAVTYTTPLIFMFVLNSLPAGLSFYYFISNVISILQQIVIRRFVDEEKIKQKLHENKSKNKDKPKSKFQQRMEEAMKMAEEQRKLEQNKKKKS
jgi:YidC/Oxa1 family membrane protein insertase